MLILATIAQCYSLSLEPGQRVDADPFITFRLSHGLRVSIEPRRQ
jgi:hypothetical protein